MFDAKDQIAVGEAMQLSHARDKAEENAVRLDHIEKRVHNIARVVAEIAMIIRDEK